MTYNLIYSSDSTMSTQIEVTGLIDTVYTPSTPLAEDTRYFWKVQAVTNTGKSIWNYGRLGTFVTNDANQAPGQVTGVFPEIGRILGPGSVNFTWNEPEDDLNDFLL
jgi:hypothetical protein